MLCPKCNSSLRVASSYLTFANDDTPRKATEAYINLVMVCVNDSCGNFAGKDLSNPSIVTETIKHKTN